MSTKEKIVKITKELINVINQGDYESYTQLCDPELTAFEPEAIGNLVVGMSFHKFYFDNVVAHKVINNTIVNPIVHLLGSDVACIAYIRLTQFIDKQGHPHSHQSQETRIWHKKNGQWRCIHFHRSHMGNTSSSTSNN